METSKSRSSATNNHQEAMIQKPIVIPLFMLKFQLPSELFLPIVASNLHGVSIVSVNSTRDENKVMSKLSQTCRYFYSFYQHLSLFISINLLLFIIFSLLLQST